MSGRSIGSDRRWITARLSEVNELDDGGRPDPRRQALARSVRHDDRIYQGLQQISRSTAYSAGRWRASMNNTSCDLRSQIRDGVRPMIVLGLILLLIGFLTGISILWTIGIVLIVVGVILALLGATGRAVGGRKHWY